MQSDALFFSKSFFRKCVKEEVYKGRKSFVERIWAKWLAPETNSVYLIRKYLYILHSRPNSIFHHLLRKKLMTKYGIHVSSNTRIDLGLKICHPSNIMITNAKIGKNCTLFHNVTIGAKYENACVDDSPIIGDNVTFFSHSSCFGKIVICDNVRLGSYCCVINDVCSSGTYIGIGKDVRKI